MQTFLPYEDFAQSAKSLDRTRLGKQRVETLQIMKALVDPSYGWQNHPAVKMWRGYEWALYQYQVAICEEWTNRGYKDTCLTKTFVVIDEAGIPLNPSMPPWLGNENIHRSHRSNLVRKMPEHYALQFDDVDGTLPYVWPDMAIEFQ